MVNQVKQAAVNNSAVSCASSSEWLTKNLKAETLMLQVQMLVAEDFNNQMEALGEKIKLLSDVKKAYRENINKIKQFMAQNANTSRDDNRQYFEASTAQMSELMSACVEYNYDLDSCQFNPESDFTSMTILEGQGYSDTGAAKDFFDTVSAQVAEGDIAGAVDSAKTIGDDDNNLPYYFGHTNNTFEDGSPKFAVISESVNVMLEQVQNHLTDVEEKSEQLGLDLNQLTSQRRAAIEGANELMRKMADIKNNTVSKLG